MIVYIQHSKWHICYFSFTHRNRLRNAIQVFPTGADTSHRHATPLGPSGTTNVSLRVVEKRYPKGHNLPIK